MTPDRPSDEDRLYEELSAYLDGELGSQEIRRVEERLARDSQYRAELARLERAWGLLDRLPRSRVDDVFAKSTIEMVAVAASEDAAAAVAEAPQRGNRKRWWALTALGVAILVGFGIGAWATPNPDSDLLADLPVLDNFVLFYQADDIKFLRLLESENLFVDAVGEPGPTSATAAIGAGTSEPWGARRRRVLGMSPAEQQDLLKRQERFLSLPLAEQDRFRTLEAEIDADPQAARLHQVLVNYHAWLKTISATERDELSDKKLPLEDRVTRVKRIQQAQKDARQQQHILELPTSEDLRVVEQWIEDVVWVHREAVLKDLPSARAKSIASLDEPQQRKALLTSALSSRGPGLLPGQGQPGGQGRRGGGPGGAPGRGGAPAGGQGRGPGLGPGGPGQPGNGRAGVMQLVDKQDIAQLQQRLSTGPRTELAAAANLQAQRRIVNRWVGMALQRGDPGSSARLQSLAVEELAQFFEKELEPRQREQLLNMPVEKMREELRRLYLEHERAELGREEGALGGLADRDVPAGNRGARGGGVRGTKGNAGKGNTGKGNNAKNNSAKSGGKNNAGKNAAGTANNRRAGKTGAKGNAAKAGKGQGPDDNEGKLDERDPALERPAPSDEPAASSPPRLQPATPPVD